MHADLIKTWKIGDVEVSRIVEVPDVAADFALLLKDPEPDLADRYPFLKPDHVTEDGLHKINFQGFAIKAGDRRFIVDTCIGANRQRKFDIFCNLQSDFIADLQRIGIAAEEVDAVLCTHMHFDHIGWNVYFADGEWKPAFPNARYLFGREEYAHWMALREAGSEEDVRHIEECVDPIVEAGLADLVETDHQLCDEIRLMPTPGHTPGHVSIHICSRGEEAIITGDLIHHPVQVILPEHIGNFDMDKDVAARQRVKFIEKYVDTPVKIIGTHFCDPTIGHFVTEGSIRRFR